MPRTWPHPSSRRPQTTRVPAWALVALLHLAVLLSLWKLPVWSDRAAAVVHQAPLVLTLWQQVRRAADPTHRATAPSQRTPAPQKPRPEPQAITLPAAPPEPDSTAAPTPREGREPAAPESRTAADSAPAPALNLSLPRGASAAWRQRNPALDDPRSNTARLTMEQKLANAMGGDGTWQMERLDNDHIRYRRGNECVLATRSRAGQLELGNGAFRNAWMVGNC